MLRRAQTRSIEEDGDARGGDAGPRTDRRARDTGRTEADWAEAPIADRRNLDAWRAEVLQTLITDDEPVVQSSKGSAWRSLLQPSRVLLLLVALVAGGVAAYLATRDNEPAVEAIAQPVEAPAEAAPQVVAAPTQQVLVARLRIAVGERLSAASLEWAEWPETAVRAEYITLTSSPEAMNEMSQSMARGAFFPGEPIRHEKLATAGEGYLAAVLKDGSRGVSVAVAAESASGGFIVPDDHVDVVLTRPSSLGQVSDTILTNVRVLAINAWLGGTARQQDSTESGEDASSAAVFSDMAIATLELDPEQAEVIINATTVGKLALVLRPTTEATDGRDAQQQAANQAIRISSPFWTTAGGTGQ